MRFFGGAVPDPLTLQDSLIIDNTDDEVLLIRKDNDAGDVVKVDTRDPAVVGANMDAVEIYLNGSDGSSNEITGGAYNIRNLFLFSSVDSGTQSQLHRAIHAQVRATGNAVYSNASGGSIRGAHLAAVWNSTGTCAAISGVQTNVSISTAGITTGLVSEAVGQRVLVDYTGTGNGSCTTAQGVLIQPFGNTSANRTITNAVGLEIQDIVATGITNAWAIRTGTGFVEFGDSVIHSGRNQEDKGADVASGSTITCGDDGNFFSVTGTTTIDHMTTTGWQDGSMVSLLFVSALTVNHNTGSPPANTSAFQLNGSANQAFTAGSTLTVRFDGSSWIEIGRMIA